MADVVAMEEAGLKENVNPVGGLWGQPRREGKLRSAGFGLGLVEARSKERSGVLAPNATLGNSGGVEALEWLKDRMVRHKMVFKDQPELDLGSRQLKNKLGSPAADGKLDGALGKSSAGLASKELGGIPAGREPSEFSSHPSPTHSKATIFQSRTVIEKQERSVRDHRISSCVQAVAAKSQRPANVGIIQIYQDDPANLHDQRDASRREVKAKPVEILSPGAAGSGARGLGSRLNIEERSKVSRNSFTNPESSKSHLQQQLQGDGKKPSSHNIRSGAWSGSKRQGTPYNPIVHQSRHSADQPERSKREVKVDTGRIIKSPSAAVRRLASRTQIDQNGSQISPTTSALLSRIQHPQIDVKKLVTLKSPNSTIDNGCSSFVTRKGTPYKCRSRPLEQDGATKVSRDDDRVSPCQVKDFREFDLQDLKDGEDVTVAAPKRSPLYQVRNVEHSEVTRKNDVGPNANAAVLEGNIFRHSDCHSEDRATAKVFADRELLPLPAEDIRSTPTFKAGVGNCKWSRSSEAWSQAEDGSSPSEDVAEDEVSKWNTNMDITAVVGHGSALLTYEMTGASSSGSSSTPYLIANPSIDEETVKSCDCVDPSSSTPCLVGNSSSIDEHTVKSQDSEHPTPSAENALSYSRLSTSQKLSRVKKRLKSLGPACRVLRSEGVESCNSRISHASTAPANERVYSAFGMPSCSIPIVSPVLVAPVIESDFSGLTAEEAEKNVGQLGHPWSDPKKRKAERDPSSGDTSQEIGRSSSGGDINTSQVLEQTSSALESVIEKEIEEAAVAQQQHVRGTSGMDSIPKAQPRKLASKEGDEDVARPRLAIKQVSGSTKLQPRISPGKGGRFVHSEKSSVSWPTTLRASSAAPDGRSSSTALTQSHNEVDAHRVLKDSTRRSDNRRVQGGVHSKASRNEAPGSSVTENISRSGSQREQLAERGKRRGQLATKPSHVKEGREPPAVDMSLDGLSSGESKENGSIPVVPDLSNCLGSLSLEGNYLPKTDQSRLPLQNRVNKFPIPSIAPANHLTASTSLEHGGAPLSSSNSVRSVSSIGRDLPDQIRSSPNPAKPGQRTGAAGHLVRTSPVLSDEPKGDQSNKAVGLPSTEHKVETEKGAVPSERALDLGATATKNGMGGATALSQIKKMVENAQFVYVNNKRYQKLGRIGKGGSSEVYKVIDGDCTIYALKKINLKGRDHSMARGYYQEIEYLERLLGKQNVVQLIACEVTNKAVIMEDYQEEKISEDACIYMVLEFGEIDLAGILSKKRKQMLESNEIIDDNWLRFYWKHMLLAVKTIHDERIVHADLKPANFLLVKGELKLIDFGIAKAIQNDTTHIVRDSQVGTLNYMAPEAFMTNSLDEEGRMVKCGRASDIWSLGCILYQMVYGHTPFSKVDSLYAKIQAVTSKSYKIDFPPIPDPWLLDAMKQCLTWDRHSRPHITDLLQHPFLRPELASQHKLAND